MTSRPRHTARPFAAGGWLRQGAWTVLDQALFAGANFLVNVLLARWLTPEGYGAYTVAYTAFLFLGTLHAGFLVEPMLVYGSARFERRLEAYLRVLLTGHGRLVLVASIVFGIGAAVCWSSGLLVLGHALAAFAVGQALILFQWLMRSACYVRTQPQIAATTGLVYAALMVAGVVALNHWDLLNEATGIGLMAGASLAAGTLIAIRLRVPLRRGDDAALAAEAVRKHRQYGSWAAGTGALEWFHGFLPFLLLPLWFGLGETGALRALFNLVLPVLHVFHALAHMLVPVFVRARVEGSGRRVAGLVGAALVVVTLGYAVAVEVGGPALMSWLYDGKYDAYTGLLWIVAVLPIVLAVSNVAQALLRSEERPEIVFAARGAASGVAATLGAASVFVFGVAGALFSDLLTAFTESAVMVWFLKRGTIVDETPAVPAEGPGRKRVLLVAFACGPGRGSEPGQGWLFAHRVAERHDVTALVYSGFRPAIERELAARPVPGLRVVYSRLPFEAARHHAEGVDRTGWREQVHYPLWNWGASLLAHRLHAETPFDLVHHVSLMRYWSPSAATGVAGDGVPFLFGPVGGGESTPAPFYRAFSPAGRRQERLRDLARDLGRFLPGARAASRRATLALATTDESAAAMRRLGAAAVEVPTASVALRTDEIGRLADVPAPAPGPVVFAAVGRLLHWKGYDLALRAFARAVTDDATGALDGAAFWILGDGPERAHLAETARRHGIADRVHLLGHLDRNACLDRIGRSTVVVHPSFHDSGGYATLEGMAAGRPVVCLALGGPALQVTPATGVVVPAVTPAQAEADLAAAFLRLAADPALCQRMGAAGRARVAAHYSAEALVGLVLDRYDRLLAVPGASSDGLPAVDALRDLTLVTA